MPSTRIDAVRDAIAAKINAAWIPAATAVTTPPTSGQRARETALDEVVTRTRWEINTRKYDGRKIYIVRDKLGTAPFDRDEDQNDYTFGIIVAELYAERDDPPEEWIAARVAFCEWLLNLLGNPRSANLLATSEPGSGLYPQEAEITVVIDLSELDERKMFVSHLTLTFREQTTAAVEG